MSWEYVLGLWSVCAALLALGAWMDERRERRLAAARLERQKQISRFLAGHRELSKRDIISR